jgi:hypothetical protein
LKLSRKLIAISMAGLIAMSTAGCIKLDMSLNVSSQDTVSGEVTMAVSKSLYEYAQKNGGDTSTLPQTDNLLGSQTEATVKKFDDGKFMGNTYVIKDVPLEKFATADKEQLSITRDGDYILVSGKLDMSGGDPESVKQAMANPLTAAFFEGTEIKVAITLPGTIESTTGTQDGNTITWQGTMGDTLDIQAKARSPKGGFDLLYVGGGALALAVIVGAVIFFRRKKPAETEKASE